MKKSAILFPLLVATMISCNNTTNNETANTKKVDSSAAAPAPAKETTLATPQMDSATMMKNWQEYMTPGDMQKMLASYNGTWSGEITMWMDPSKPPTKNIGTCENKMIMDGRYQLSTNKGNFNGMPFEGISTTGYDNAKKVFVNTWVDNMGTGIMYLEGPWDAATKTITLKGKSVDPMTGKSIEVRQTIKMIDDKNQLMEMYMIPASGKEYKSMEIKFTKK